MTSTTPRPHVPPRPRRPLRTVLAAAVAAIGLLVLAGCMKIDMGFTLSEDDTASGTVIMGFSDELAESMGMDPAELWDMADEGEDGLTSELPEGATEEPYSDGEYTGVQITYADQPIDSMSSDELSIERQGDEYVVEGVMDLTDMTEDMDEMGGEVPEDLFDSFLVRVAVTFPGEISETSGTVEGNTAVWEPAVGERTEISARGSAVAGGGAAEDPAEEASEAPMDDGATDGSDDEVAPHAADDMSDVADESSSGFPWWIVGAVLGVAILAGVAYLIVRNNRKGPPAGGTGIGSQPYGAGTPPPYATGQVPPSYGQPQVPAPPVIPPQSGPIDPYRPEDPDSTPHEPR